MRVNRALQFYRTLRRLEIKAAPTDTVAMLEFQAKADTIRRWLEYKLFLRKMFNCE